MLCQDIVSTPRSELDRDIIQNERLYQAQLVINVGLVLLKVGEGRLVAQGVFDKLKVYQPVEF